jgi:hypothetical protein
VYTLKNGQSWRQIAPVLSRNHAVSPKVLIYKLGRDYKMIVEGDDSEPVSVQRIR